MSSDNELQAEGKLLADLDLALFRRDSREVYPEDANYCKCCGEPPETCDCDRGNW